MKYSVGLVHYHDGWNILIEIDDYRRVFDPTFATEAEALECVTKIQVGLDATQNPEPS